MHGIASNLLRAVTLTAIFRRTSNMRDKKNLFGRIFSKGNVQTIEIEIDLIEFQEDGLYYMYTPALDLIGYGRTKEEAKKSWDIVMQEYFKYTMNKKTFIEDLENHGWSISKKHLNPPSFTWLIQNNEQVSEVVNKHNYYKTTRPVKMPLAEVCA